MRSSLFTFLSAALLVFCHVQAAGEKLFIAGNNSGNVAVVDLDTNEIIDVIDLVNDTGFDAVEDLQAVAVDSTNHRVYVAGEATGNIAVIDANTHVLLDVIDLLTGEGEEIGNPKSIVTNPSRNLAYVIGRGGLEYGIINTQNNTKIATVDILTPDPAITGAFDLAIDQTKQLLYIVGSDNSNIGVYNLLTNSREAVIDLTTGTAVTTPRAIALDVGINKGLVVSLTTDNAGVLNLLTNAKDNVINLATAPALTMPIGVDINPLTHLGYITDSGGANVAIVNLLTNTRAGVIPTPAATSNIVIDPIREAGYATSASAPTNFLYILDLVGNTTTKTVELTPEVQGNSNPLAIYYPPSDEDGGDEVERAELLDVFRMFKNTSFTRGVRVQ